MMTRSLLTLLAATLLATTGACALRLAPSMPATPTAPDVVTERDRAIREITTCSDIGCVPATPDLDAREDGAPITIIPVVLRATF